MPRAKRQGKSSCQTGRPARRSGVMKTTLLIGALTLAGAWFAAAGQPLPADTIPAAEGPIQVFPINHATFVLQHGGRTIYVDPVGGEKAFAGFAKPGLILVTHIHGDHFSTETLTAVAGPDTKLVAPPSVAEQLPANLKERTTVLKNGESGEVTGVRIQAIPAYNTTPERLKFHPKGRDNGYVVSLGGKRIYISGDTEDIPEMRALKDIAAAFVCMNLPYTMTPEQAAGAVREFKPAVVYPYHSRGTDLESFKAKVGADSGTEVRLLSWYK